MKSNLLVGLVAWSALAFGAAASAQTVTYQGDIPLPVNPGLILPVTGTPGSAIGGHYLVKTGALFELDYSTWTYGVPNPMTGVLTFQGALVAHTGTSSAFVSGPQFRLYSFDVATNATYEWDQSQDLGWGAATNNTMVARSPSELVLVVSNKIYRDLLTGFHTVLIDTNGTAPGQLETTGSAAFGPDGLLYVLDEANGIQRIQRFDITPGLAEADRFQGSFNLAFPVSSLAGGMAISSTARLYLGDGLGGGSVYKLDGTFVENFTGAFTSGPDPIGGKPFLNLDRFGNVFVYTPDTSLHRYHDPAAVAAPQLQNYWKRNPALWPVASLTLGDESYAQSALLALLKKAPAASGKKADASLILAYQLIAAKLNIENGVPASASVLAAVASADALLAPYPGVLPYHVGPSTLSGQEMVNVAGVLAAFNQGL